MAMPENLGGGLASPRLYGAGNVSFSKADAGAAAAHLSSMARPIAQRATPFSGYTSAAGPVGENSLDSEAWHACAGPLVCLPRVGDRVVYFPQGHIEQVVASTNQSADLQIPHYNLPSQIFCRVLNLSLGAYRETDEVYAQMTLVPENEQTDQSLEMEEPPVSAKPKLSMFCKNLTSSDTSTHGGFSVPRRAAEECFPQLDYGQSPPAQELIAKDLHGVEWKFRHIYRGQPRRHLLTTGWSVFVSQKKLVAGDAVLFVRGDNGELRIGVRRAVRPQNSVTSSSLLSSHSMQLGVLAAAAHAVSTKTMFTIFYNPRASPAEFVVPYYKYRKSFKLNLSVGMRFKMRFETEDSSERSVRYMGTITGIGDIDPQQWPGSKWRFLKVGWDEHAASERKERVSPWEIEPFIAPNVSTPLVSLATKRLRPTMLTDLGFRSSYDLGSSMHFQQVLQGNHDLQTSHKQSDERDVLAKSSMWASKPDITKNKVPGRMTGAENYMAMLNFNSGSLFGGSLQEEFELPVTPPKLDMHQQQLRICVQQFREQRANTQFEKFPSFGIQPTSDYAALSAYMKPQNPENSYLKLLSSPRPPFEPNNPTGARVEVDEPVPMESFKGQEEKHCAKSTERDCKLFGFSLISKPPVADSNVLLTATCKLGATPEGISSEHVVEPPYSAPAYGYITPGVRSSASQNWIQLPNRTCTKVHKQGAVGRAVDLSKFEGYSELLKEISQLFGIGEVLNDSDAGWQAVYIDNEGDMLLVGDDPWGEFCTSVRSIRLLSPAEVQKMTLCRNSTTDEPSSRDVSRLSDQQDSSSSPPASSSEEV